MKFENTKKKMIKKLENENKLLLDILNYIEYDLYLKDYKEFSENKNSIIYINNIHSVIENTFNFHLKLNNNFENDYKVYKEYNNYLLDIIKFYVKKSNSILASVLILHNNIIIDNNIKNINDFVTIIKK